MEAQKAVLAAACKSSSLSTSLTVEGDEEPLIADGERFRSFRCAVLSRAFCAQSAQARSHLPDFHCRQQGLNFEEENRSPSLKEVLTKPKQMSARERLKRLKANLDARKKSAAEADGLRRFGHPRGSPGGCSGAEARA